MATVGFVSATGVQDIDGLLSGVKWIGTLTYSFPDSASDYPNYNGFGEPTASGFGQVTTQQQQTVHTILSLVADYTNLEIVYAGTNSSDIRIAQSSGADPTALAYYPGSNEGGDVWFGTNYNFGNPALGGYYYFTHIHELGHALGLKHSHDEGGVSGTSVSADHDALEFTVMSYYSYVGATLPAYTNGSYDYPTTYMRDDIRALQEMYGADFTTQSGDSSYAWNPSTGEISINGVGQGTPAANRVFMTIWDGGGNDTYDFSAYSGGVTVDLNPGSSSVTSTVQLARLGNGHYAEGNVYNAYLYDDDPRSLIENVIGGGGNDRLTGNLTDNRLDGRAGSDILSGGGGNDVFVFGAGYGSDVITDFVAGGVLDRIELLGLAGFDSLGDVLVVGSQVGEDTFFAFGVDLFLTLQDVQLTSITGDDFFFASGPPNENPNSVVLSDYSIEEEVAGAAVASISVGDPNGDTVFSFEVSDPRFVVTGAPGAYILGLVSGVAIDFETEASIVLEIAVTDAGDLSFSRTLNLSVLDSAGENIIGTRLDDVVDATNGPAGQDHTTRESDYVLGMGGNDRINGLDGDDSVLGASGNDCLYGDAGNDSLFGGIGNDCLEGGEGNDALTGGAGADLLSGGAGDDVFFVSGSHAMWDTVSGDGGDDTLRILGNGHVKFNAFSATAASIEVWSGNGWGVSGTAAANVLDFSGLTSASGLLLINGGLGDDSLTGTRFADDLRGGGGNDRLEGGEGNDILGGGSGSDTFVFGPGIGEDLVTDFKAGAAGTDVIAFTGVFTNYAEVMAASVQVGTNVLITIDASNTVMLGNVKIGDIDASDFAFI